MIVDAAEFKGTFFYFTLHMYYVMNKNYIFQMKTIVLASNHPLQCTFLIVCVIQFTVHFFNCFCYTICTEQNHFFV